MMRLRSIAHAGFRYWHYRASLMVPVLLLALTGCHSTRHVVTDMQQKSDSSSVHREQTSVQHLDSLISHLSASADSITIVFPGDTTPLSGSRITVHSPRISHEQKSGSATLTQTLAADSTRSNIEARTTTDDSKETIGGAEPPNLTWVFIVLGLGVTLLLIGAVILLLWLHKKGVL